MDSFGSDRKLSELGLDLDFLDPVVMDPDELFPTIQHHHDEVPLLTEHHHVSNHVLQFRHHHQTTPTPSSALTLNHKSDQQLPVSHRRHQYRPESTCDIDDVCESDLVDDEEVVMGSEWLDEFLQDNERYHHHHHADGLATSEDDIDVVGPQHVSHEHSYSLANEYVIKMESDELDMETGTGIFEMIDPDMALITSTDLPPCADRYGVMTSRDETATPCGDSTDDVTCCCPDIKSEPVDVMYPFSPVESAYYEASNTVDLPLTPPSSSGSSSDSEAGGLSPRNSPPSSPYRLTVSPPPQSRVTSSGAGHHHHHHQQTSQHSVWTASLSTNQQSYYSNQIASSGILILSEEEKRTLVAEGYPIPSKLPLTKQEEKNLKKIRRKIKNKISAQESRRKKKEYLETLEKQVETVSIENMNLRKKMTDLESANRRLNSELQRLNSLHKMSSSMQSATCITVN